MVHLVDRRWIVRGAAVAIVFAAAFLLLDIEAPGQAPETPIDTAADVTLSQCEQCHTRLGRVDQPGLIFDHGNHLLVSCDGCHSRLPHREGGTETVPMEVCYACHGVEHGPQGELATGECLSCHTTNFTLRPKSHVEDWKEKPHADAGIALGVNGCMMCHDAPIDCDECHEQEQVDVGPMPDVYHTQVGERLKDPSIKMYPDGPVTMSQCVYCHPDIDDITTGRLIFAHAEHLRRDYPCDACHEEFPHEPGAIKVPDMQSCYRCHGFEHAAQGLVASEECEKCHPDEFDLVPQNHTSAFITKEHGERATEDAAYCAMCHKPDFCIECHTGESTSPNAPDEAVVPASHEKAEWMRKHGGLYLDGEGACGSCHTSESCKECHQTVMPHPVGWIKNHRPQDEGVPPEDCNVCHVDRSDCQDCHHSEVKRAELTEENCAPCHDEMKQQPATGIQNKGYAEHAVHFNVAEEKGKPYRCYECHIEFGTSEAAEKLELQQGHDLRLCYDCHGALDPFNKQIAPYKGAALCVRCHTDLGV